MFSLRERERKKKDSHSHARALLFRDDYVLRKGVMLRRDGTSIERPGGGGVRLREQTRRFFHQFAYARFVYLNEPLRDFLSVFFGKRFPFDENAGNVEILFRRDEIFQRIFEHEHSVGFEWLNFFVVGLVASATA